MKKSIKIIFLTLGFIIIVIIIYISYNNHFSQKAIKGKNNLAHSKNLVVGMTESELLYIMGRPDTIIREKYVIYCYDLNDDSYASGQVYFDSTMKIEEIYFPNN